MVGMLYLEKGVLDRALTSLRRAVFLDDRDPLAQFSLGRAWLLSGDPARARVALLHAGRQLASLSDEAPVPGCASMRAGELRRAVQTQLDAISTRRAA
jgi:hypothetical protein